MVPNKMNGPVGAPGPEFIGVDKGMEWMEMMRSISKKYDVDLGEILVGTEDVPPSASECLVYICLTTAWKAEYYRKDKSPHGRWICAETVLNQCKEETK